jgi:hypothetical protein
VNLLVQTIVHCVNLDLIQQLLEQILKQHVNFVQLELILQKFLQIPVQIASIVLQDIIQTLLAQLQFLRAKFAKLEHSLIDNLQNVFLAQLELILRQMVETQHLALVVQKELIQQQLLQIQVPFVCHVFLELILIIWQAQVAQNVQLVITIQIPQVLQMMLV